MATSFLDISFWIDFIAKEYFFFLHFCVKDSCLSALCQIKGIIQLHGGLAQLAHPLEN